MNILRTLLAATLLAACANAASYPTLNTHWSINLGGDKLDVRDVDHDGSLNVMVGLFRDVGSYAYLLDNNGTLLWRNKISVIWPNNSPHTLIVDSLDNNLTDIIVGSVVEAKTCSAGLAPYNNPIFVLERNPEVENNMLKWVHNGYGYSISMDAKDIDGDSKKEVISGARDGTIRAINYDGTLRWAYKIGEGSANAVYVTDINRDNLGEIIVGGYKSLTLLNYLGNKIWAYDTGTQIGAVYAEDINGDSLKEILAVSENNTLLALTTGGDLQWSTHLASIKPTIASADLDGDGYNEAIVASGNIVYAYNQTGQEIWEQDLDYPIIQIKAAPLIDEQQTLVVLGARTTTTYDINPDYIKNKKAQNHLNAAKKYVINRTFDTAAEEAQTAYDLLTQLKDNQTAEEAQKIIQDSDMNIQAATSYDNAVQLYAHGNYTPAKEAAVTAEKLYLQLGDSDRTNLALAVANKAIDEINAVSFYQRALEYYRAEDYVQGSAYSLKALRMFTTLKDEANVNKTQKLLNNTQEYPKANKKYAEATKLLELGNLTGAKATAEEAKVAYATVGDDGRGESTDKLIANINDKIDRQQRNEKAQEYLSRAQNKFDTTNYHGCIDDANTTVNIYANLTDTENQNKAQTLLARCANGVEAQRYYSKAYEYYMSQEYDAAIDYASKARQLYRTIDYPDGAVKTTDLILEIQAEQKTQQTTTSITNNQNTIIIAAAAVAIIIIIAAAALLLMRASKKKTAKEEPPKVDYTSLLPEPKTGEKPPETPAAEPTEPPKTPEPEKPPEVILEQSITTKLDELLAKAGVNQTTIPKIPETPTPEIEIKIPETNKLEDILNPKIEIKTPEPTIEEKPPEPPEEPPETTTKTLKIAEKIKRELAELNKKLNE